MHHFWLVYKYVCDSKFLKLGLATSLCGVIAMKSVSVQKLNALGNYANMIFVLKYKQVLAIATYLLNVIRLWQKDR